MAVPRLTEQTERDKKDSEREAAPLTAADDAVQLDASSMPLSEVVRRVEETVRAALNRRK